MNILGWRCWYEGDAVYQGRTFTEWQALPADGVIHVMVYYDQNDRSGKPLRMSLQGHDHYFLTPNGVLGSNNDTLADIKQRYPGASIKRGKWVLADEQQKINKLASKDYNRP
jgi:hypothetical protein